MTEQVETVYNENDIRLIGATAFNPFSEYTSSSRGQMQANAISQHYVISGCKPNMIQTGADIEYGRFSNSITTPHNMVVFSIVNRYIPSQHNGIQLKTKVLVHYSVLSISRVLVHHILSLVLNINQLKKHKIFVSVTVFQKEQYYTIHLQKINMVCIHQVLI